MLQVVLHDCQPRSSLFASTQTVSLCWTAPKARFNFTSAYMQLPFTKMQGSGNDFVVFDAVKRSISFTPDQIRSLSDRRLGIGCDQVLLVEPATENRFDFRFRIFNADGGEVEQCGNGARCVARFVREKGLTDKDEIVVDTRGGPVFVRFQAGGEIAVNMGVPRFNPAEVPFTAPHRANVYALDVGGQILEIGVVSVGNPHAVQIVSDVDAAPVATLGPAIERHLRFPQRVNAGFMQVIDRNHIRLRVYERGAGETPACGSGACAAVVSGRVRGVLEERVEVSLPGGKLQVCFAGEGEPVWMTGPAEFVFEGTINLDA